jgi:diadenosine tetraphosphate (Ap4A) HIT family hydrolase
LSDSCSYCAELKGDSSKSYFLNSVSEEIGLENRYLFETESFVVFPSIGALVEGHLLLVPKEHITAIAHLDTTKLSELENLITHIESVLLDVFDLPVIAMEHGVLVEEKVERICVSHAHLHILPLNYDLVSAISDKQTKVKLSDFCSQALNDDYLLVSNNLEDYYISDFNEHPSQYLRKLIFDNNSLDGDWNWIIDQRLNVMKNTFIKLTNYFLSKKGKDIE